MTASRSSRCGRHSAGWAFAPTYLPKQGFEFSTQDGGENYSGLSLRSAVPGGTIDTSFNKDSPPKVAYVYWHGEEYESYTFSNYYWLVEFEDGRFASISAMSSGTCSYCGSCSDDIAFARTLREAVQFGMGENERRMMGVYLA